MLSIIKVQIILWVYITHIWNILNNDLDNIIKLEDITCNSSTNKFNIDDYDIYQYNKIIFIRLKFTIVNESIESNSTVRI